MVRVKGGSPSNLFTGLWPDFEKKYKTLLDYDHMRAEFEDLIKILDENNDPT